MSVAATERVAGNERKGYYNTAQNAKAQATNPHEREVSSQLVLRNVNTEDSLSKSQEKKKKLSTLRLNTKLILPKHQGNATASTIDSICKKECRSLETVDQYHWHYAKKCKNKLKRCLAITLFRNYIHHTETPSPWFGEM